MTTSQLLSFHDVGGLPCIGGFDEREFQVKELRIKDLHKNLCKRPQPDIKFGLYNRRKPSAASARCEQCLECSTELGVFQNAHKLGKNPAWGAAQRQRFHTNEVPQENYGPPPEVSQRRASTAEASEQHGEKAKTFRVPAESSETKYESCEDDVMEDSEAVRVGMFSSKPDLRQEDSRNSKREGEKPDATHFCSPISEDVDSHRSRRQPCQFPAATDPVNSPVPRREDDGTSGESPGLVASLFDDLLTYSSSEQRTPSTSLKHSNLPPLSGQRCQTSRRSSGASFDDYECVNVSTDSEPAEGRDRNPERKKRLRSNSPHVIKKKISPTSAKAIEKKASPTVKKNGTSIASKSKETKGRKIQRELDPKKGKTTESKSRQSKTSPQSREGKSMHTSKSSIANRKLEYGYFSEDTSDDMELDTDCKSRDYPTFAVEMKRSNVITGYSLTIPAEFSCTHMPDTSEYVVLQDAQGLKWEANFLAKKNILSGGWGRFARDHRLELGDVIVFELVKPLKFRVHVNGVSEDRRANYPQIK